MNPVLNVISMSVLNVTFVVLNVDPVKMVSLAIHLLKDVTTPLTTILLIAKANTNDNIFQLIFF